jgi:hypothetical protein
MYRVQRPEYALEDPNRYRAAFWMDRSEGFDEWETNGLPLGSYAVQTNALKRNTGSVIQAECSHSRR